MHCVANTGANPPYPYMWFCIFYWWNDRGNFFAHVWDDFISPIFLIGGDNRFSKYPKELASHHTCPPRWVPALPFHKHRPKDLPAALKICVYIYISSACCQVLGILERQKRKLLSLLSVWEECLRAQLSGPRSFQQSSKIFTYFLQMLTIKFSKQAWEGYAQLISAFWKGNEHPNPLCSSGNQTMAVVSLVWLCRLDDLQ